MISFEMIWIFEEKTKCFTDKCFTMCINNRESFAVGWFAIWTKKMVKFDLPKYVINTIKKTSLSDYEKNGKFDQNKIKHQDNRKWLLYI